MQNTDPFYQLGFDIATGLFGDPAKGTRSTLLGPGSLAIRSGLNAAGQKDLMIPRNFTLAASIVIPFAFAGQRS